MVSFDRFCRSVEANTLGSRFGLAEQAINAIYVLASQPDVLCGEIVKQKTRAVFSKGDRILSTPQSTGAGETENTSTASRGLSSVRSLSQLLFIVGHIASTPLQLRINFLVKQIIHIELCEAEFKRRKVELEKGAFSVSSGPHVVAKHSDTDPKTTSNKEPDDLEMIGGTSEDDFAEGIALVRFVQALCVQLTR